jgi:hypothetical protein
MEKGIENPAVVRIQRTAKRHMEVRDRELPVMKFSVHLQRTFVVAIVDYPD